MIAVGWEWNFLATHRSKLQAVGTGPTIIPSTMKAAIQELSSLVMGSGESGAVSFTREGEVQP